jgi:alanyl-tRNA synthetase
VHSKEIPFEVAKSINGVRFMEDARYPEMVRVVSIGPSVDDLLVDPTSDKGMQFSVELCGGTHLTNVSKAVQFVILDESSISMGTRRITAVTGSKAIEAISQLAELEVMFATARATSGPGLKEMIKNLRNELAERVIPAVDRIRLIGEEKLLVKRLLAEEKAASALLADAAKSSIQAAIAAAVEAGSSVGSCVVDMGGNNKPFSKLVQNETKKSDVAMMVVSVDEVKGKVLCAASCPKAVVAKGVKAGDWLKVALAVVSGRGGGKPNFASGSGTDTTKVDEALSTASAWIEAKL